jgi:hypothetical protein
MHFNAGLILPARFTKNSSTRQIIRAVEKLLFRFSEEFEVKPYFEECDCVVESTTFFNKRNKRYGKADPSCDECKGTGRMKTTYNEFACFDWWEIGGRWDGHLPGTKRTSNILWRNCVIVKELPTGYYFFAVVTPNKEWHEQWQFRARKGSEAKEIAFVERVPNEAIEKVSEQFSGSDRLPSLDCM